MRKTTLFISAALTAFMLAVMFGVVTAYQNVAGSTAQPEAAQASGVDMAQAPVVELPQAPAQMPTQIPAEVPAQPANVTPEEAAAIASKVIGRTDLYSVEMTQFEGVDAYLVTFSSRDLVYVSLQGQVLSISKLPVTIVANSSGKNPDRNENKGGERESHDDDEHEGGDD